MHLLFVSHVRTFFFPFPFYFPVSLTSSYHVLINNSNGFCLVTGEEPLNLLGELKRLPKDWYNKINLWKQYVFNTCWDNIEFVSISRRSSDFSLAEDQESSCGCLSLRSVCHLFISNYSRNSGDLTFYYRKVWVRVSVGDWDSSC